MMTKPSLYLNLVLKNRDEKEKNDEKMVSSQS